MPRRTFNRREFLILGGGTLGAAALAGCGAPAISPATPTARASGPASARPSTQAGGVLTYAHLTDFVTFGGHLLHAASFPMFNLVYNPLIVLDESMQPQPELAESWSWSDDNRALTLQLRRGVKFHNGRELTSEDVKFNLEYLQDPENAANTRPLASLIEAVEIGDAHKLTLRLSRVAPNIFDLLDLAYIMAPEAIGDIKTMGVGTGPFRMEEWRPGVSASFSHFGEYFKPGLPLLDAVVVDLLGDAASMVVGLENGSIDVIERFPPSEAQRLEQADGVAVANVFGGFIADILVNTKEPPFDDRRVRQAIGHALNRQRMIDIAMAGIGEPWCIPFPENSIAFDPAVAARCEYDLEAAGRLLDEAGLGSGFEFELLVSTAVLPASPLQAQIWQADLSQIGVTANIVDVESADYFQRTGDRNYQVAVHQFRGANRDPDTLFLSVIPWYPTGNFSQFESDEYARLIEEAGTTADVDLRRKLYSELGELIVDEAFVFPLAPAPSLFGVNDRVKGLSWNVEGFPKYENVSLG